MSPVHRRVRERGTLKFGALCALFTLTAFSAAPGATAGSQPPVTVRHPLVATPMTKTLNKKTMNKKTSKKKKPRTITGMIRQEFDEHAGDALLVARCESHLDPGAVNAGAVGIFQIRTTLHDWRVEKVEGRDLYDPRTNVRVARHLFEDEGWRPWSCARIVGLTA